MIIYYTFPEVQYMKYDYSGQYPRGKGYLEDYEYEYLVDVSAKDLADFCDLHDEKHIQAINRLMANGLIDIEDDDFKAFMYEKYYDKALEECEKELMEVN